MLYCPECNSYLLDTGGDYTDCLCGWKQPPTEPKEECCNWSSKNGNNWESDCGNTMGFSTIEQFEYCPFCGDLLNIEAE